MRVGVRVQEADKRPSLGMIVRVDLISGVPPMPTTTTSVDDIAYAIMMVN